MATRLGGKPKLILNLSTLMQALLQCALRNHECKIEQQEQDEKVTGSDLCKFPISAWETAEKISQLIFTGSMNLGSSDFLGKW